MDTMLAAGADFGNGPSGSRRGSGGFSRTGPSGMLWPEVQRMDAAATHAERGTLQVLLELARSEDLSSAGLDVTSSLLPADVPHAVRAVSRFKMILTMIKSKAE